MKPLLSLILLLVISWPARAEIITLNNEQGQPITAEYLPGEADKPLVILIHAFLQTREFPTSRRLAEALNEDGYPTLTPTLSLGIANRRKSLPCESLQMHSLDQEVAEIAAWMDWAKQKGLSRQSLVGHSAGSISVLAYLDHVSKQPPEGLQQAILISLTYYGPGRPAAFETTAQIRQARAALARGESGIQPYSLSFCEHYMTRPADFLSYMKFSRQHILEVIQNSPVPVSIVIGSKDFRMGEEWKEQLESSGSHVLIIENANHFFDQSHELDLLDTVEQLLETPTAE